LAAAYSAVDTARFHFVLLTAQSFSVVMIEWVGPVVSAAPTGGLEKVAVARLVVRRSIRSLG
jgi:hypothetical protein